MCLNTSRAAREDEDVFAAPHQFGTVRAVAENRALQHDEVAPDGKLEVIPVREQAQRNAALPEQAVGEQHDVEHAEHGMIADEQRRPVGGYAVQVVELGAKYQRSKRLAHQKRTGAGVFSCGRSSLTGLRYSSLTPARRSAVRAPGAAHGRG